MAIVFKFHCEDPNNVGSFPPSVLASAWWATLNTYSEARGYYSGPTNPDSQEGVVFIFADQAAFDEYLALACTDETLLADIDSWKSANNVSYTSVAYNYDTTAPISFTPIVS